MATLKSATNPQAVSKAEVALEVQAMTAAEEERDGDPTEGAPAGDQVLEEVRAAQALVAAKAAPEEAAAFGRWLVSAAQAGMQGRADAAE